MYLKSKKVPKNSKCMKSLKKYKKSQNVRIIKKNVPKISKSNTRFKKYQNLKMYQKSKKVPKISINVSKL